jgi:hypothetical protein
MLPDVARTECQGGYKHFADRQHQYRGMQDISGESTGIPQQQTVDPNPF